MVISIMKQWLTSQYIAHRGLFDNKTIPENTLASAKNAVDNGFGMELDVQMTTDGVLCVFHDDTLDRMTNTTGTVEEMSWDEVKDIKLLDTEHTIPTMQQWLDTVDGKSPMVIEIKTHKNIGVLETKLVEMLSHYNGDFVLESFNPFIVRWLRVHYPHLVTGQLSELYTDAPKLGKFTKWLLRNLKFLRYSKAQFVAYDVTATAQLKKFQRIRKRIPIIVWTVKSQAQHDENRHLYDNMIFDSFVPTRDDLQEGSHE